MVKYVIFCANYVQTFGLKTTKSIKKQEWDKVNETKKPLNISGFQVIPEGFEPSTYCLEGSCSIQLSYGT